MLELLAQRSVALNDLSDVERLKHKDIVNFKNSSPKVFDRREDESYFFYYGNYFGNSPVSELIIPLERIVVRGNRILYSSSMHIMDEVVDFSNGDYYNSRFEDLKTLGLLRR